MNEEIFKENQTVPINEQLICDDSDSLRYLIISGVAVLVLTCTIQLWIAVTKPSDYTLFEKFVTEWSAWSECSPARVFIFISRAHDCRFFNILSRS